MRRFFQAVAVIAMVGTVAVMASVIYIYFTLPDKFMIAEGEDFAIRSNLNIKTSVELPQGRTLQTVNQAGNTYQAQLKLLGAVPIKQITVQVVDKQMVAACGNPFGIKMFTDGVMVVGLSDLDTAQGAVNPAKNAGIHIGDVVMRMNGQEVYSNEQVGKIVADSGGVPITINLLRKNEPMTVTLLPGKNPVDGGYKAGMWVRDSSAGIGTMTFYDPVSGVFGGLGHAVCDVDTGEIMPLMSGEAVQVDITGCVRGESGTPGELQGRFYENSRMGNLYINNETGIYGTLNAKITPPVLMPIAFRQEVKASPAVILTTLDGSTPQQYDIMIEKVNFGDNNPTKNMVIHITDPRLLERTGGIVQGMSGSPIIQDGKLVGAVTHVFVNDPTRGFGVFAENMYYSVEKVETAVQIAS